MARMHSKKVEQKALALLMQPPFHLRALRLETESFALEETRVVAELIKKYVQKYKSPPSKETLRGFANSSLSNERDAEVLVGAMRTLEALPSVNVSEAEFYFDKLQNFLIGRKIFDMGENLSETFSKGEIDFREVRRGLLNQLLTMGEMDDNVSRGYIFSNVEERWSDYLKGESGQDADIVPFGIPSLDDKLGGLRKKFVSLVYSKTGGGKTRLAINLAYNAAKAGYNVIYFSFEMSFNLIASCFDSRIAGVDSREIIYRRLSPEDKEKYKVALKKQFKENLNIWIVDYAMNARSSIILEETALYKAATGKEPDFIIVDYANIMKPMEQYGNRSERLGSLFEEFHEMAKYLNVALLTGAQEGREKGKQEANSKTRDEDNEGVHNLGQSHYMATHCDMVVRLKQDQNDRLQSRVWVIIDKHRYGNVGLKIPIMARWATTYVGDRIRVET